MPHRFLWGIFLLGFSSKSAAKLQVTFGPSRLITKVTRCPRFLRGTSLEFRNT
jgi:hypothetical protein